MKSQLKLLIFALILSALSGCGNKLDIGNFDSDGWKADLNGCKGDRASMTEQLNEIKSKLLGLHQKKVIRALGQPEEQELYERSQNYYFYYIDAGSKCEAPSENPRRLEIRFTALGIANEVNIR